MLRIWGWEGRAENIKLGKKFKAEFLAIARLVSWCFRPSQPQRITSGLKETFVKRYIAERTSKAEIRPEEQSEEAESCRWNL